jgi:hypothetical protein
VESPVHVKKIVWISDEHGGNATSLWVEKVDAESVPEAIKERKRKETSWIQEGNDWFKGFVLHIESEHDNSTAYWDPVWVAGDGSTREALPQQLDSWYFRPYHWDVQKESVKYSIGLSEKIPEWAQEELNRAAGESGYAAAVREREKREQEKRER